ncbi:response regulator [Bacteroides sp. OttesenSCG-928-J23]|nr:response regulator [Bacteroides sp. OttesenSCG-928-J23]MDL2303785.1 response regulator [Bacteroides sp. OttesenSCG-928-D19]
MKTTINHFRLFFSLFLCLLALSTLSASTLRQYSTSNGLKNLFITTIFQDKHGLLWLGTHDGISTFDGASIRNLFGGNTVGKIIEAQGDILWFTTNQGLYRLDSRKMIVDVYEKIGVDAKIVATDAGELLVMHQDNFLTCVDADGKAYEISLRDVAADSVMEIFIDNNTLWIFADDGNHQSFGIQRQGEKISFVPGHQFRHSEPILWCFYEAGSVYFIDASLTFFEYNLGTRTKAHIKDVRARVLEMGDITSIVKHHNDFFIGFAPGGLLHIENTPDQEEKYQLRQLPLQAGILSLATDKQQDILWIGTQGQGFYMYYSDASSVEGTLAANFPHPVASAITAVYLDRNQTLWMGTQSDGVINIHNYRPGKEAGKSSEIFQISNSLLAHNTISAIQPSQKNILWIGTEGGLSYYSYHERRIKSLAVVAGGKPLKNIHSLCELNDTTLWVGTSNSEVVKIHLAITPDSPIVVDARKFELKEEPEAAIICTSICKETDRSVLLSINTGRLYHVNSQTNQMEVVSKTKKNDSDLGKIWTIQKGDQKYWIGTSEGFVCVTEKFDYLYKQTQGAPFKDVYGIQEDRSGNIWLATNEGIAKFNPQTRSTQLCPQTDGKIINNFAKNACFRDPVNNILFFGGANGFVTVNENEYTNPDFTPPVHFTELTIFGNKENIHNHLIYKGKKEVLTLDYTQNTFAVWFVAKDFIDGQHFHYSYKLDNGQDEWVNNGTNTVASFSYLPCGRHTLLVKYKNSLTGKESPVYQLKIRIIPPWYLAWWAILGYILLAAGIIYLVVLLVRWKIRRKVEKTKAEMTNNFLEQAKYMKMNFLAGALNEISRLTGFIINAVAKIPQESNYNFEVNVYTDLISQSANQTKEYIHATNEYNKLMQDQRTLHIELFSVSEVTDYQLGHVLTDSLDKDVNVVIEIDPEIYWYTDRYCFRTVIAYMLQYTVRKMPDEKDLTVILREKNNELVFMIHYHARDKQVHDLMKSFDEGTLFKQLEINTCEGNPILPDLNLAICFEMVKFMGGRTEIMYDEEKDLNTYAFVLPNLSHKADGLTTIYDEKPLLSYTTIEMPSVPVSKPKTITAQNIMLLSTDILTIWMLNDTLSRNYSITVQSQMQNALGLFEANDYEVLIVDAKMINADGIEMVKHLKNMPAKCNTLCIVLGFRNTAAEKESAMEAGADIYIEKPFVSAEVQRIVERNLLYKYLVSQDVEEIEVDFNYIDEHDEDDVRKDFMDRFFEIVDNNLTNDELSIEFICKEINYISQDLFIELHEITDKTANQLINDYRFSRAEILLISTNKSVEQIVEETGFDMANFENIFMLKYASTPVNYRTNYQKRIWKEVFNATKI